MTRIIVSKSRSQYIVDIEKSRSIITFVINIYFSYTIVNDLNNKS